MTMGQRFKAVRMQASLTQEQLAQATGIPVFIIDDWEKDKASPIVAWAETCSEFLNVHLDYLIDEDEEIIDNEIREAIDVKAYDPDGSAMSRRFDACVEKYKDADAIFLVTRERKMGVIRSFIEYHKDPGMSLLRNHLNEILSCYIVVKGNRQCLVKVTDYAIITVPLMENVDVNKFVLGKYVYKFYGV